MLTQGRTANAFALFTMLRLHGCFSAKQAMTDREIADVTGMHTRQVIDAAHELLRHGVLVLAGSHGRWIGSKAEATRYAEQLRSRAGKIYARVRAVRAGITAHQKQLELFTETK